MAPNCPMSQEELEEIFSDVDSTNVNELTEKNIYFYL